MKLIYCLLVAACLAIMPVVTSAYEGITHYRDITVGSQPIGMVFSGNENARVLNVFCAGKDLDFDGMPDEGDETPSWWQINIVNNSGSYELGEAQKLKDFEFGYISFPFRAGVIESENLIFISHLGRIRSFDLASGNVVDDTVLDLSDKIVPAVSAFEQNLFISVRDTAKNKNYVIQYNYNDKVIKDTIMAGINVQQALPLGPFGIAILNEGDYSSGKSSVQLVQFDESGSHNLATLEIGKGANHLVQSDSYIVATINGSHEIKILDLEEMSTYLTIALPTSGYDGPRESYIGFDQGAIFTTAYNGKVYITSFEEELLVDSLELHGKGEAITSLQGLPFLFVANSFQKDSYGTDTVISVFAQASPVHNPSELAFDVTVYPNPASDYLVLKSSNWISNTDNINCELINTAGITLSHFTIPNGNGNLNHIIDINAIGVPNGLYYLKLNSGNKTEIIPFTVVR